MLGLEAAHEIQHLTGQRHEIHGGGQHHIVEIVGIDEVHIVPHHAFCRFGAAAAIHARGDIGAISRNFHHFAGEMTFKLCN